MSDCRLLLPTLAMLIAVAGCSRHAGDSSAASQDEGSAAAEASADSGQTKPKSGKARGLPANALRVQKVEILDRNGFEKPIAASFGFVPVGWKTQGGVQWDRKFMCTNGYNVNWTATSPDGAQAIAVLPQEKWESNNYGAGPSTPGCGSAQTTSAQQYLTQLVQRSKQGARVSNYRPRPDLAAKLAHLNNRTPSAMGEMRTWVEAGQVQFSYREQGRDMSGMAVAVVVFSLSRMQGMGMGTMDALTGFALPGFAATAPEGKLNLKFVEALRQSFLPNPEWQARISRHNTAIAHVAQVEAGKRSKIISETNDYISRIRQETADAKAKSDDRRQREFGEAIRGTEHYDDADAPGGQVELSGMYDNAWRLNDGTYVLSNDAGFDPWRDLGVEGKRLEATK